MSKIKINYHLLHEDTKEKKVHLGIKRNDTIFFQDNDILFKIKLNNIISIERKSKDYKLEMNFEKNSITDGTYQIYTLGTFYLKIKTIFFSQNENNIHLKYELTINNEYNGLFDLQLNYEVIE